ncbi:MAG: 6-pyruvoyl tetrahydropterin synthase family protein [Candidatus Aenigmatarchaeota archaeon]
MKLGMEFEISYSHSLEGHSRCGKKHEHTSKVVVEAEGEVKGGPELKDNMLMDFFEMGKICKDVLAGLDGKDLNEIFDFPTAENIAKWIFDNLKDKIPVAKVVFFEEDDKWCVVEK